MTPLLVLHRLGEPDGGARWRDGLLVNQWHGPALAPDLPWHGAAVPEFDYFDHADLVMVALRMLRELAWAERPVVIAVGEQFAVAHVLALADRASGIVLVDAPPIHDVDPDEAQRLTYEWLRRVADAPGQAHGLPPFVDAPFWERQRAAIPVPVLELHDDAPTGVLAAVREWWAAVAS